MPWKYIIPGILSAGLVLTGLFLLLRALSRFTRFIKGDTPAVMAQYQKMARSRPEPGGKVYRDIRYKQGLLKEQKLDIYMPLGSRGHAPAEGISTTVAIPAVVIVHGGSWMHGSKEDIRIIDRFLERMRREGWAVISIDYVSSPLGLLGAPSRNVRRALKWIRHNTAEYGIDPRRLGLYSFSAGSQLTMEALNASDSPAEEWRFWLSEYGPVDLGAMAREKDSRASEVFGRFPQWYLRRHSPALHVHSPFPPVMLVHGDADQAVPLNQSEILGKRLKTVGTEVTLMVVPGGDHGFFGNTQEVWMKIEDAVFPFMRKHFQ